MTTDNPTPEEALAAARDAVAKASEVAVSAQAGSALVLGRDDAVQTKKQLGSAFSVVTRERKAALEKIAKAKAVVEAERDRMNEMLRAMDAELAPMKKLAARLEDGISAVNLYLGTDEELEELRGGESAPADTPLVIRQAVLAMDEEGAFYTLVEGEVFDYRNVDEFLKWLTSSDEHLNQVIPDTRGVVAIMPRRTPVDYDLDAFSAQRKNEANRHTYWLLRNGERLYLLDTEFSVGSHLIPTRRSFTKLFEDRDGTPLEPGSRAWLEAEEAADKVTRHYMKVALILQGLVDRTAVFHPLPEGGLNLISNESYDAGHVILIEDEEKAIGTGRQPFKEWLKERVAQVAVGQRVVGYWPGSSGGQYSESFTHPKWASNPESNSVHIVHREDANNWYFAYERTDEVEKRDRWGYITYGPAEKRATYRIPKDSWGSATFVPIDNVTVAEMQEYLAARTERHAYQTMFPALKAAIDFKVAEEAAEAPFRALIATACGLEDEEIRELVTWWKTANKWHRPLNGDQAFEARAVKAIAAESDRRTRAVPAKGLAALHALPDTMVIASRSNDLIAIVPEKRAYVAESVPANIYVAIHLFTLQGKPISVKRWQTLTRAQVAKWTVLGESKDWATWQLNVTPGTHLPDPAIDTLITEVREWAEAQGHGAVTVIKYEEPSALISAKAQVYWASRLSNKDALEQPFCTLYIDMKGGVGTFERGDRNWIQTYDWRLENQRTRSDEEAEAAGEFLASFRRSGAEVPVAPHGVNYSDSAHPGSVVYLNREAIKEDYKLAAGWADRTRATRSRREAKNTVESALVQAWVAHDEETRRARFIEDFGDAELWEDHRKSQKPAPFPIERYRSWNNDRSALDAFTEAVVKEGVTVAGKTVAEVLASLSAKVEGLPESLLPVRFAPAESNGSSP